VVTLRVNPVQRLGNQYGSGMWIRIRFNADPDAGETVYADPDTVANFNSDP